MYEIRSREADEPSRVREPRLNRLTHTHAKIELALRDFIYARPKTVALGPDPIVRQLMSAAGFGTLDYAAMAFTVRGVRATALVATNRLRRDQYNRALLLLVKAQAAELGTKILLVPQSSICGTSRGRAASTVAKSRGVRYAARHVDAVMNHVAQARITTVAECAAVIPAHEDPVGVLLAMTAMGFLDIDKSKPIQASTWITTSL